MPAFGAVLLWHRDDVFVHVLCVLRPALRQSEQVSQAVLGISNNRPEFQARPNCSETLTSTLVKDFHNRVPKALQNSDGPGFYSCQLFHSC